MCHNGCILVTCNSMNAARRLPSEAQSKFWRQQRLPAVRLSSVEGQLLSAEATMSDARPAQRKSHDGRNIDGRHSAPEVDSRGRSKRVKSSGGRATSGISIELGVAKLSGL